MPADLLALERRHRHGDGQVRLPVPAGPCRWSRGNVADGLDILLLPKVALPACLVGYGHGIARKPRYLLSGRWLSSLWPG